LWFIGVVRDRIGAGEDRVLRQGVLGQRAAVHRHALRGWCDRWRVVLAADDRPAAEVWSFGRRVSLMLLTVYAMRMAAVFAISTTTTTTIAAGLGLAPRWLTFLGLATGVVLLVRLGSSHGSR
jgi:hypothetical protein